MNIRMIGIDHAKATVKEREIFAFTPIQCRQAMKWAVQTYSINGCVIVSTCNRTELWVSEREGCRTDLKELLYSLKHIENEDRHQYDHLFVLRESHQAYHHLFQTTCGLKSQVWGENQILSQIKKAIEEARETNTADVYLEKLFQIAITSAKRVKTCTKLTAADVSVATKALEKIREIFPNLKRKQCLVIGNGEMGKIVAEQLVACGAEVCITLRQYKSGAYILPRLCTGVDYEKRFDEMVNADVVVSATASPHYTIKAEQLDRVIKRSNKTRIFIDLAVPRDIDPKVHDFENITLLDMDSLGLGQEELRNQSSVALANEIIDEHIEEYLEWLQFRNYLPLVQRISNSTSERICIHLKKELKELNLSDIEQVSFENKLAQVTEKAVSIVLYGLKDSIHRDLWDECFRNLDKAVR